VIRYDHIAGPYIMKYPLHTMKKAQYALSTVHMCAFHVLYLYKEPIVWYRKWSHCESVHDEITPTYYEKSPAYSEHSPHMWFWNLTSLQRAHSVITLWVLMWWNYPLYIYIYIYIYLCMCILRRMKRAQHTLNTAHVRDFHIYVYMYMPYFPTRTQWMKNKVIHILT